MNRPRLADEPTVNLDRNGAPRIELLLTITAARSTLVVVPTSGDCTVSARGLLRDVIAERGGLDDFVAYGAPRDLSA